MSIETIYYLKADYEFEEDSNKWLSIKIDEKAKKIFYSKEQTAVLTFDESKYDLLPTPNKKGYIH